MDFKGNRSIHDIVRQPSISKYLLDYCDLRTICRLAQTSQDIAVAISVYRQSKWQINAFLSNWFRSPAYFRSTLRICDAVLYGTAIRCFLNRTKPTSTLEILLSIEGFKEMGRWLTVFGYAMTPHTIPTITRGSRQTTSFPLVCANLMTIKRLRPKYTHNAIFTFKNRNNPTRIVAISIARQDAIADILDSPTSAYIISIE